MSKNRNRPPVKVFNKAAAPQQQETDTQHFPLPAGSSFNPSSAHVGSGNAKTVVPNPAVQRTPPPPAAPLPQGEVDPDLIAVTLPSNFEPYAFKTLHVRAIKAKHQAKFHAAARRKSLHMLVETISSLLDGVSAFDLTVPDFRWLLYYLRKTNYVKVPLIITAWCSAEEHLLDIQSGKKQAETLKNLGSLNQSTLEEKALDVETLHDWISKDEYLSVTDLGWQTMRDAVEALAFEEDAGDEGAEDTVWLAEMASFLSKTDASGNVLSLKDRMKIVEELSPDDVSSLQKYAIWAGDYGVSEFIKLSCKDCGADIVERFHLSASSFL